MRGEVLCHSSKFQLRIHNDPVNIHPGSGWSGGRPGCGANFAEAATAIAESRSVCSLRLFAKHAEGMRR
jgi:hypothetical protein